LSKDAFATILTSNSSILAEGPLWHPEHRRVYWTDIDGGLLHAYDPATGLSEVVHSGSPIGGFTLQEDGCLLLFRAKSAVHLFRDGAIEVLIDHIPDERETRFNDVAADPQGRVFCGTMPTTDRKGRLYRLDPDLSLTVILENVGCSNGMGWSPDRRTMYHVDSAEATIFAFDFDPETGDTANRRSLFKLTTGGTPDGMTVDADGCLWAAVWGGACLIQVDPQGAEMRRIPMPAPNVTCPAFGGPEYLELYVTTAGGGQPDSPRGAGELIRVEVEARGVPEFRSRIGL